MDRKRKAIIAGNQVSRLSTYRLGGYEQKVLLDGKSEKKGVIQLLEEHLIRWGVIKIVYHPLTGMR